MNNIKYPLLLMRESICTFSSHDPLKSPGLFRDSGGGTVEI